MAKDTTDSVKSFSTFFLNKHKKLESGTATLGNSIIWSRNGKETGRINYDVSITDSDSYVRLKYKLRRWGEEEWRSIDYRIPLEAIPCHFGGKRWYFRCPLTKNGCFCDRRVAFLYEVGDYFGCRHCADLTYESCNESKRMRGWPWKILTDAWKADELMAEVKVKYYNGKPTRKYRQCLKLWKDDLDVIKAEEQLYKQL